MCFCKYVYKLIENHAPHTNAEYNLIEKLYLIEKILLFFSSIFFGIFLRFVMIFYSHSTCEHLRFFVFLNFNWLILKLKAINITFHNLKLYIFLDRSKIKCVLLKQFSWFRCRYVQLISKARREKKTTFITTQKRNIVHKLSRIVLFILFLFLGTRTPK